MPLIEDTARAFMPYPDAPLPHAAAGPLAGLSFAVKDLFDVAGYPTGCGQPLKLAQSGLRSSTAPTVQRLLDAGARFVGKTLTDELAFSMNGQNAHFGSPLNGAAPERIAGGSSSGSASAVSNRLCDFALGTDTGGSVRAPASHNGLIGLRPTHGRISLQGAMDLAPSLDTCGWFSRDGATYARVADVLLGDDPAPLPAAVRLLLPPDLWALLQPEVLAALAPARAAVEALLGAARPAPPVTDSLDAMYWHFRHLQGREAWQVHGAFIERHQPPLGPGVAQRFAWSRSVTAEQYAAALEFRQAFRAQLAQLLGSDGVLLLPTMPDIAPRTDADEASLEDYRNRAIRLLSTSGLSGFPQISLPLASRLGAPLGLSLLGPPGSDRSLVHLAGLLLPAAR
ncbi:amidase [Aquabacterium sp.]|uniref:amidase n=1 Tax=Aquabacterium sp. TaxID=1872578 RepID=UPI002B700AB4|nr:amidase [Aquabacterium sp.]HSW08427.1 amidase [Aquabacterium sp.]